MTYIDILLFRLFPSSFFFKIRAARTQAPTTTNCLDFKKYIYRYIYIYIYIYTHCFGLENNISIIVYMTNFLVYQYFKKKQFPVVTDLFRANRKEERYLVISA